MTDYAFASATELVAAIKSKEISSLELTDLYIERIEKLDGEINAVVVHDFERGREAAIAADTSLAKKSDLGPLHGLPMTIKEAYDIEGLPTTWGVPELRDNIATTDADTVQRLKKAGAHFIGKTNVPLNLADFQSFNEIYGTTNNPWDLTRIPGGSSGGSAAALAAGLTGLEAGSDIGGSIRNPAHFCGVYGHKPTWGVVSDIGHATPGVVAPVDIAVVGPLARSAEDLALSMDIVAGANSLDRPGWQLNLPKPSKTKLSEYRVAIWPSDERAPVSQEIADRVQTLGDQLSKLGATVSDSARPDIDLTASFETYNSLLWGVMAAGLSEEEKAVNREIRANSTGETDVAAQMAYFSVQEHSEWASHNNLRHHLRRAWARFFTDWDILLCPQMATTAFPHDQGHYLSRTITVDNEDQDYFQQIFWSGTITVAHLPSTVFPTGPGNDGLPIGLQAVGAEFQDYTTIEFSRLLAQEFGGFVPPPGYS
ncbi:MAG: amidase [Proteobacteria bacterium]|nr:amidase [Pseudomonadota bacterium]